MFLFSLVEKVNSHLCIDNFAFFKDPIGIDSSQELVRHAKKRVMKKVLESYNQ